MLKKITFNEPVIWFALAGAALFALDRAIDPTPEHPRRIHVSEAQVRTIEARETRRLGGRRPDATRLRRLVAQYVDEEVLARHGEALGLADDDPIIRRRIVQKVQLAADAEVPAPTNAALESYVRDNAERFQREARWDISVRSYGSGPEASSRALRALGSGELDAGVRPLPFTERLGLRGVSELESLLGAEVVDALLKQHCRDGDGSAKCPWFGPVPSKHGALLLRVHRHRPARLPALAEVQHLARQEWMNEARHRARAARVDALRAAYEVAIDWPESLPAPIAQVKP